MSSSGLLSTAVYHSKASGWSTLRSLTSLFAARRRHEQPRTVVAVVSNAATPAETRPDMQLPKKGSLVICILENVLGQTSFFIIVSSGSEYARFLGGTDAFSGLVLGIPTICSALMLLPLMRYDRGQYRFTLLFACAAGSLGSMLYGLAYRAQFLYLILISRLVLGLAFVCFLYIKRYLSDARIVGTRRRTTLAGWFVAGQNAGFVIGPFLGGLLYKIGFNNEIFNGYTSPGWIMAALWATFGIASAIWFEDVPPIAPAVHSGSESDLAIPVEPMSASTSDQDVVVTRCSIEEGRDLPELDSSAANPPNVAYRPCASQWGVVATMCWFSMTCFFVLGGWEANIPVYTASAFGSSPFAAGNLIALGGLCTFPFIFLNVIFARKFQDRHILAAGAGIGLIGLVVSITVLATGSMTYWALLACWILVALGFNIASTVTVSLLSKQMPHRWVGHLNLAVEYSSVVGRVTGAVWGGAGPGIGMSAYVGLQIALLGIGSVMFMTLWHQLKTKAG
ncbi:unnamed protein product [Peniophora sp. CBMAI 1063]|nr:unnamed protein product [Peniophora sp. CBMAI 1063]